MSLSDTRFVALQTWLEGFFATSVQLTLICGDASFRRYFRVEHNKQHFIVSDSPIELVPIDPFIAVAEQYHQAGLNVPQIIAVNRQLGFVLQSDLGDEQLLQVLSSANVAHYYQQALSLLPAIARVTATDLGALAAFDEEFVLRELGIFTEWLLQQHLQYHCTAAEQSLIDEAFKLLTRNALAQPQVGMHRDFHSRNLLVCGDHLGVIDFQDAVVGPVTYDAVSLLRDCYVKWPQEVVQQAMEYHFELMKRTGIIAPQTDLTTYQIWFDLMGMQRHIKAAGIFARLYHRDDKPGYLKDIPLTLSYIVDIGKQYPALSDFSQWLERDIVPLVSAQMKPES